MPVDLAEQRRDLENEQRDPSGLHSSRHGTWVARNAGAGSIDVDECVKLAAELYEKATGEKYERSSAGGTQTQRSP
jgi:hypothetical protein